MNFGDSRQQIANHVYFPTLVGDDDPLSRDDLYAKLKANGIHWRRCFYPLISDFPMYRGLPSAQAGHLPVTADAAAWVICPPIYPALDDTGQARIIEPLPQ